MKKIGVLIVAIASFTFIGCSRGDYVKPGATKAQIASAEAACYQEAKRRVHYASALSQKFARETYTIDCMERKGILVRWKYDKLKKEGKLGQPSKIDTLTASCYRGDTIACYSAGTHYEKQDIRSVGSSGLKKAILLFKKGCESYAPNKSTQMRAKNLCCNHYNLLK